MKRKVRLLWMVICLLMYNTVLAEDTDMLLNNLLLPEDTLRTELLLYDFHGGAVYCDGILRSYRSDGNSDIFIIPEGVTGIDSHAFRSIEKDELKSIYLPASCISIDGVKGGIEGNRLGYVESVFVADNNPVYTSIDGVLYTKDKTKLLYYPFGRNDASFVIPEGVKVVGSEAFFARELLEEVTFPSTLEEIENYAFECNSLKSIHLPNSLLHIGEHAFDDSDYLEEVVIPGSVRTIEAYAFAQCSQLRSIILCEGIQRIESFTFFASPIAELELPASCSI